MKKVEQISIFHFSREQAGRARVRHAGPEGCRHQHPRPFARRHVRFRVLRLDRQRRGEGQAGPEGKTDLPSAVRVSSPCLCLTSGGLHGILEVLSKEKINVEVYVRYVERSGEHAIIIFRFNATGPRIEVLDESGFTVLPEGESVAASSNPFL